jgi:hypothetical protein
VAHGYGVPTPELPGSAGGARPIPDRQTNDWSGNVVATLLATIEPIAAACYRPHPPVVASARLTLEAGYNWHLTKPVDPTQLSLVATAVAEGPTQIG